MKIIELLTKIANGEEVPKRIKYDTKEMKYDHNKQDYLGYYSNGNGEWLFQYLFDRCRNTEHFINDEVEIIEGDKFKYIDQIHNDDDIPQRYNSKIKNTNLTFTDLDRITWYKVNELIDEINELRKIIYNFKNIEELDVDLYTTEGGIRTAKKINEIIDCLEDNKE